MSRRTGTPNKATLGRERAVALDGLTPLDFMLSILRNEQHALKNRMWAAVNAAPYVHPKLAQIDTRVWAEMNARMGDSESRVDPAMLTYDQREALRELMTATAREAVALGLTIEGDYSDKAA